MCRRTINLDSPENNTIVSKSMLYLLCHHYFRNFMHKISQRRKYSLFLIWYEIFRIYCLAEMKEIIFNTPCRSQKMIRNTNIHICSGTFHKIAAIICTHIILFVFFLILKLLGMYSSLSVVFPNLDLEEIAIGQSYLQTPSQS